MHTLDIIAVFILLSGIFLYINAFHLRLPSSVGLIVLSLALSFGLLIYSTIFPDFKDDVIHLINEADFEQVLFEVVLSFMLFAGAINVDFKKLEQSKTPTIVLSSLGVLISILLIGYSLYYTLIWVGAELDILYCFMFAALISPTDPLAVITELPNYKVSLNLSEKIKGESLLNNAVSVVLAVLLHHLAVANAVEPLSAMDFLSISSLFILGGTVVGILLGLLGYWALKVIDNDDVEVEVLVTLALAMVATQVATLFDVSPVQAIVVMGLLIGNMGRKKDEEGAVGEYVFKFWSLIEAAFNVMLFVLIGLEMIALEVRLEIFAVGFIAVVLVIVSRWLSILLPIKLSNMRKTYDNKDIRLLTWGSLKSGLSVALALSLPEFEGKDVVLTLTYIVVVFSVLYQGLTISILLKQSYAKIIKPKNEVN
ncbi:MAG: sodium:proton antiporter [Reichenbachiella sp.]